MFYLFIGLPFGCLQVFQECQTSNSCFLFSYVYSLVVCKFFKSTKVINLLPSSFALQLFNELQLQLPMFIFFFMCLFSTHLQVFQKCRSSNVRSLSSCIYFLVVCKFFKSAKLPTFIFFLPMFTLWSFSSFSKMPK